MGREWRSRERSGRVTFERAGFRRNTGEGWTYYVLPGAWAEIFAGMDLKQVNRVLLEKGFLVPDKQGKAQGTERLPGFGKSVRCYRVRPCLMEGRVMRLIPLPNFAPNEAERASRAPGIRCDARDRCDTGA